MTNYTIDTSIWIAYFQGNKAVKELIEEEKLNTSTIAIAELGSVFLKQKKSFEKELIFIKSRAKIIPLTTEIALASARVKNKQRKKNPKFGLADGMHYATAIKETSILITKDNDFQGLERAKIIG